MISFASDYMEGAHPSILRRLSEINTSQQPGYGTDGICESAKAKIRLACNAPKADIFFISGGTQTNQLAIDTLLGPCEAVLAAKTGHISLHEAGAIEYTGHKVLELDPTDGKISAAQIEACMEAFRADENNIKMVQPGMVYISHPTEYGTLYSLAELEALSETCRRYGLPLYLDGARLGYALGCPASDVTLPDLARLCDLFYIGGTKVGALMGEALVFPQGNAPKRFRSMVKLHGALLAKGWILGVQFDELFTDGLYEKLGRHAIEMAELVQQIFREKGYLLYPPSPTNQQFIVLSDEQYKQLEKLVTFGYWEPYDASHSVVRFATSWATRREDVEYLREIL